MDVLWFLERRLEFIGKLYGDSTAPFQEIMRKIENGEEPYVDMRNPESVSEPAFLDEWQDANESREVIGQWCLNMVQSSLFAFLSQYVEEMASDFRRIFSDYATLKAKLSKTAASSAFERYQRFFRDEFYIDWNLSPVKVTDLEQINLTRNDLQHEIGVVTTSVYQSKKHAERYPKSLFGEEFYFAAGFERPRINVTRDNLDYAIGVVQAFCGWLEQIRLNYPGHVKSLAKASSH